MSDRYRITVIPGDGIGPEVIAEGTKVLKKVAELEGFEVEFQYAAMGGNSYDSTGETLPEETLRLCKEGDAVLLGAVGGPKWDNLPVEHRAETALLKLRKRLDVYANLRVVLMFQGMEDSTPIKPEKVEGIDIMVVRELVGGIYFGEKKRYRNEAGEVASDLLIYSEAEIERIVRRAFEISRMRRKHVTSVDKANVLETSRLWRSIVERVKEDYPDVELQHMLVDNCAMQLVNYPKQFDVIVTENMFGDILSDEASVLTGSIGMLPSASLGEGSFGLYEPIHGTAPDIEGMGIANPVATILSVALMLKYSFGRAEIGERLADAVQEVLRQGLRTADVATPGKPTLSTVEMGDAIVRQMESVARN